MQDRQRQCGSLAGAGLGNADDITMREGRRYRKILNGRGREVFFLGERAHDRFGEAEIMKR
jgi:hypothetical protein